MGIVPDGLSFVTAAERHEVNEAQVQMMMSLNRQKMQESSSMWMPEIDTGTAKQQTLGEAQIRLETSSSLSNALMTQTYGRAQFLYYECCRRFCLKGSKHPLTKKFQEAVRKRGVPEDIIDVECWEITPNRILGGGNKALEALQADRLMAARPAYDPASQRKILYMYTLANTDSADVANELVPMDDVEISDGAQLATLSFGTLMEGVPVVNKRGYSEIDYCKTMLGLSAMILQQLENLEQMPQSVTIRMQKCAGLINVLRHVQQHLQIVAQDRVNESIARQLGDEFAQQGQELSMFLQHAQEELQENSPQAQDGEAAKLQAKLQAMMVEAGARARIKEADSQQKRDHKDVQWSEENQRRNATTIAEIQRKSALTQADVASMIRKTQADIAATDLETAANLSRPEKDEDA
jgi:hypothetical protein